jgi:hypothetical protein
MIKLVKAADTATVLYNSHPNYHIVLHPESVDIPSVSKKFIVDLYQYLIDYNKNPWGMNVVFN